MMEFDIELLKLLAAAFALLVSTATVQFKIADFVNKKRDEFPQRPKGCLPTIGEVYDWLWGYVLGILINILFFVVAGALRDATKSTQFSLIGNLLYWLYLVNLAGWVLGMIIDALRLALPAKKT